MIDLPLLAQLLNKQLIVDRSVKYPEDEYFIAVKGRASAHANDRELFTYTSNVEGMFSVARRSARYYEFWDHNQLWGYAPGGKFGALLAGDWAIQNNGLYARAEGGMTVKIDDVSAFMTTHVRSTAGADIFEFRRP
jgi:hypothetical protein